jgi:hypothetical protein
MSGIPSRTQIKLSDIKGPYPLLAVFLLIVESLLGFWLFRADGPVERVIAGFFMVLLLGAVLYVVTNVQREPVSAPTSPGLPGKVTAATELATKQEIEAPEPQKIAGPDRAYLINKPPANWLIREMGLSEFLRTRMEVETPPDVEIFGPQSESRDIQVFKAPHDTEVIPQPGKTLYEGRPFPKALKATIPVQLSILPKERYAAPLFVARSLEHNFVSFIGETLTGGGLPLRSFRSGILPNTEIKYMQAEIRQDIRNAIVNGQQGVDVSLNVVVMAIEGELTDHFLILNYPSLPGGSDPGLERDLKDLLELANSFKPLEVTPERKKEIETRKDQEFAKFLDQTKEDLFFGELSLAILRFDEDDMEDADRRNEAIQVLKPFEALANVLGLEDTGLDDIWDALREAEEGDATSFKAFFIEMRADLIEGVKAKQQGEGGKTQGTPSEESDQNIQKDE